MKKVRKGLLTLLFAVILGGILSAGAAAKTDAATTNVNLTEKNFGATSITTSSVGIKLALPYNDIQAVVRLYQGTKLIGEKTASSYASFDVTVKKNKIYFYRVRPIYKNEYIGPWSPRKAFTTMQFKLKNIETSDRVLKVTVPKISGVKSVKVMLSDKKDSGFKNNATLKPGKSKKLKYYKKKQFEYYKTYYLKGEVTLKNGVPCECAYIQNFHFYRKLK